MREEEISKIKVVLVGNGGVGKTTLGIVYTSGETPQEYIPTVFNVEEQTKTIDGKEFSISVWDTAGQEDYDRLRPLSYPETDVFVLCYSVWHKKNPDSCAYSSYEAVKQLWLPELAHHCPDTPILLVACKIDLRDHENNDDDVNIFSYEDGLAMAEKIGAKGYAECCCYPIKGVKAVFRKAVRIAVASNPKLSGEKTKNPNCSVS